MRKYTTQFVANKLSGRLSPAACPFPGRYPLRMLVKANGNVVYHGKFQASAFKAVSRTHGPERVYLIYDKAGSILLGTAPWDLRITNTSMLYRYFGMTWVSKDFLNGVIPQTVGRYRVYFNDKHNPVNRTRYTQYVNSNIPHIRTV